MTRVAVVGATGYAGAELVRILSGHPRVRLTIITSRQHAGVKFDQVYPAMAGLVDLICRDYSADLVCEHADLVFMALPHKLPMAFVPDILRDDKKVIDLSADFRFNDADVYESTYQPHSAKELLDSAVYGLSEIYADRIKNARLIGNPGCYPTSVLLPLIPLLKEEMLDPATLVADSKSGVSGAGRSLSLTSHFCEVNESFKAYKAAVHRHNPEMDAVLSREAGRPVSITFVPHLVPMTRGMLTTIYATPAADLTEKNIVDCYKNAYSRRPFIRLCQDGRLPDTLHVRGTNYCDIGFKLDKKNNRLILISAIDNLVKGAAGQAVQNMNIMLGVDETAGLLNVPFPI
ncbi:MAG: N-acetyl-gamma-glutamyl-phosphate reductase [Desulfobacterales bacterium]|nr:MAG: N-acetyl-gamma-glutamyl-phosphate reductase [Desulfobacterales bacterium]